MKNLSLLMIVLSLVACGGKSNKASNVPAPAEANPTTPKTPTATAAYTFRQKVAVAILDSGVDVTHKSLASQILINSREVANDNIDNDGNSLVDDINGWNFVDNNNKVFDYETLSQLPTDVTRFVGIRSQLSAGTVVTATDSSWYETKLQDSDFGSEVDTYTTLSHGTHVAGIIINGNPQAQIFPVKVLATDTKTNNGKINTAKFFLQSALSGLFGNLLVSSNSAGIGDAIRYVANQGALVANGSFSLGEEEIQKGLENIQVLGGFNLNIGISAALQQVKNSLTVELNNAPNTLFVFAAGNEGKNNDTVVRVPANIRRPNAITVAATNKRESLAEFSNYSSTLVDVAAPGVDIKSTMPNDSTGVLSGTSMAAPYVANIVAQVRSINPKLDVAQTRRIVLETVDVKDFLKGKILTAGIVNPERARRAAELSVSSQTLDLAIQQAKSQIADIAADK